MSNECRVSSVELRRRLIAMADADHRLREELVRDGSLFEGYNARMAELHARNAGELATIVQAVGWPGRTLIGEDGAEAAWRVLQHGIGSPPVQRAWLPLEDVAGVDERRAAVGLPTLEEQQDRVREMVARECERPPADYERRQRDIRAWAEQVGWL